MAGTRRAAAAHVLGVAPDGPKRADGGDVRRLLLAEGRVGVFCTVAGRTYATLSAALDQWASEPATIQVHVRARGGGGDGGVTGAEDRAAYLEMFKKKGASDRLDKTELRAAKWSRCALSEEELTPPVVIDGMGQLMNKEKLLQALLSRAPMPRHLAHVTGVADVVDVTLAQADTRAATATDDVGFSGTTSLDAVRFQCPVSGLPFNGKFRFVALRQTGEVVSWKAVKDLGAAVSVSLELPDGRDKITEDDYIPVHPDDADERARLRAAVEARAEAKARARAERRLEKKKRKREEASAPPPT